MKKLFAITLLLFAAHAQAQVGIGTTTPNSTLDVRGALSLNFRVFTGTTTPISSTDNTIVFTGVLASTATLPDATTCSGRMYRIKNASITIPTPVLTIATTSSQTIDGLSTWVLDEGYEAITILSNGTNWLISSQSLPNSSGSAWIQGGNSVAAAKNIGTISNYDLPFITNNTEKMRLSATGNLGIGTSSFNGAFPERLLVDAGTPGTAGNYQNVIVGKGNTNSYAQLNIQNINAGISASSDVVATADNGNETTNYVDLGINSSTNTSGIMGGINDSYLYNIGQNFLIGTGTAAKSLVFMTGGTAQSTNERMRIDGNGNVGIGTTSPTAALHVVKSNSGGNVLNLQNTSATGYSSVDFYSSTNVLSGTFGYGNGSVGAPFTGRDYFNIYGNDFILANGISSPLFVKGSTNNVGVNNAAPTEKLDVTGNIRFSGALMPNNTAGTAGTFLVSTGSGTAPIWFDASGFAWLIDGNTVGVERKFGAIDNYAVPFITNNTERMRISNTGNVGIGTAAFTGANPERLIVDAGSNGSGAFQNVIVGKGNTNSYSQLNIQNTYNGSSSGTIASSDVVATSDNGNESVNFIDMGINSSGNNSTGVLGGANTAYLYTTGGDFSIGNGTAAKPIRFFTGALASATEKMRIDGSGTTSTLLITGSIATGSIRVGTGAYTVASSDYVVINGVAGGAATWTLPAANSSGCAGRIYRLVNQGTANITLSQNVRTASATTTTTLPFAAGSNTFEIVSDGTEWRRID